MKIYGDTDDMTYGVISKKISHLYSDVFKYKRTSKNKSLTLETNNIAIAYYYRSSLVYIAVCVKHLQLYYDRQIFVKVIAPLFHFSHKIHGLKSDKYIKLKKLYLKIGKMRVNYKGLEEM